MISCLTTLLCVLLATTQAQEKASKGCRNHPDGYCLDYTKYTCPSTYHKSYFGCGQHEMCCYQNTPKPTTHTDTANGGLTRCRDHPEGFCIDYTREVCPSSYSYSYGGCGYGQKCCYKTSATPRPTVKPTALPTDWGNGANVKHCVGNNDGYCIDFSKSRCPQTYLYTYNGCGYGMKCCIPYPRKTPKPTVPATTVQAPRRKCRLHTEGYCIDYTREVCPHSYLSSYTYAECGESEKCCYPSWSTAKPTYPPTTTQSSIGSHKPCRDNPHGICVDYYNENCPSGYLYAYSGCDFRQKCCYPRPIPPTTSYHPTPGTSGNANAQCGRPSVNPDRKIVGGQDTTIEMYPWQVEIQRSGGRHHCGGSLIRHNWVLTAAHCIVGFSGLSILAGSTSISYWAYSKSQIIPIEGYVVHDRYKPKGGSYDIALIKLTKSVDLTSTKTRSICLPDATDNFEREECIVSGWGALYEDGAGPKTLQHVDVPIVARNMCRYYMGYVAPGVICAGHSAGGKDSCQGDSGGPLVCKTQDGSWKQAGVVSNGVGCARKNRLGFYTEVAAFRDWIESVIKRNS